MKRKFISDLSNWAEKKHRKPLIIRGARQVGKSYSVRMLAENMFENLVEINFEQNVDLADLFDSNQPKKIITFLEAHLGQKIISGKTLLFLDEIQKTPKVFASLRYFYEQLPELHVIAAGSLLEFMLEDYEYSMPVGRIEYMYLGPMRFEEFLLAKEETGLFDFINAVSIKDEIPKSIHDKLLEQVMLYYIVGGMPESISRFIETGSFLESSSTMQSILSTYHDDFSKYNKNKQTKDIEKVFQKIPSLIGNKLKYSSIDKEEKGVNMKKALNLLALARIVHKVYHSSGNGIPLGAEINEKYFKPLFLDIGLVCRSCGLNFEELINIQNIMLINKGALAEQFIGQHLLDQRHTFEEPKLNCWMRQKKSSQAEVDYLIQNKNQIIPVEVKAGKTGSMKSLHVFLEEKKHKLALRFNADKPSIINTQTALSTGTKHNFQLLSLPLYLIEQTDRFLEQVI